jgi:hypothetical protein
MTIQQPGIPAYIALWRNAQSDIYRARYVSFDGKRGIPWKSTLGYPVPHLLRRNVLNPSRLCVCWGFRLVDLCRRQQTSKKTI